jgi:hypothetical protein
MTINDLTCRRCKYRRTSRQLTITLCSRCRTQRTEPTLFKRVLSFLFPDKRKNPAAVALGRRGGKVRSRAKTRAARANGKKGGRLNLEAVNALKEECWPTVQGELTAEDAERSLALAKAVTEVVTALEKTNE